MTDILKTGQKAGELSKPSPSDLIMAVLKNALRNRKIHNLVILFINVMPTWSSSLLIARENKIKFKAQKLL